MQFINNLISDGYKYIFIPKGSRSKFFVTKESMLNGDFRDDAIFDEFRLTTQDEKNEFKQLKKGIFIDIQSCIWR